MRLLETWPFSCRQDKPFHTRQGPLAAALPTLQRAPAPGRAPSCSPEQCTAVGAELVLVGGHRGKLRAGESSIGRELGSFGLYSNDNQAEFL